jgi:hypothetical protein
LSIVSVRRNAVLFGDRRTGVASGAAVLSGPQLAEVRRMIERMEEHYAPSAGEDLITFVPPR